MSLFQKPNVRLAIVNLCKLLIGELSGESVAEPVAPVDPKQKLREALADPRYKYRKVETLAGIVGLSVAETEALLPAVGVRLAEKTVKQRVQVPGLYGLVSRVGTGRLPQPEATRRAPLNGVGNTVSASDVHHQQLDKLRELLSDPQYEYRKIETLSTKLGINDDLELEDLLREVGARPMVRDGENTDLWGLISRVGAGPNASDPEDDEDFDSEDDFEDDEDDFENDE